jgi:hypothetical protein
MLYLEVMARPENHSKNNRKLSLVGGRSYAVTLPIEMITTLGWKKGQNLVVRRDGKKVIIEKEI